MINVNIVAGNKKVTPSYNGHYIVSNLLGHADISSKILKAS